MTIPPIFIIGAAQRIAVHSAISQPVERRRKRQVNCRLCAAPQHHAARARRARYYVSFTAARGQQTQPSVSFLIFTIYFGTRYYLFVVFTPCCRVASAVTTRTKKHNKNGRAHHSTRGCGGDERIASFSSTLWRAKLSFWLIVCELCVPSCAPPPLTSLTLRAHIAPLKRLS